MSGTNFSWTVVENGVTGASDGSGSSIAQALIATQNATGTATYTITPTSPEGCMGSSIDVVVNVNQCPVQKPIDFQGKIEYDKFLTQTDIIHVLTWQPSPTPIVIGYKLFQNNKLIQIIPSRTIGIIKLHNRKNKLYHYKLVAFTEFAESRPAKLTL